MASIHRRMLTFDGCSFRKRTKRGFLLSLAQRKKQRNIHPTKASPRGEDATAPPVALTLMYPRPIKGSGCFYRLRWTLVDKTLVDCMSDMAGRFGCGSSITLIIYAIELTPGALRRVQGPWGREALEIRKCTNRFL